MSARAIPSLDGLRAISVALVVLSHLWREGPVPGGLGVTVFFFLSGYLITTLMRLEYDRHGGVSLRNFWIRRALRILPPFYLVLVVTTLAALAFDPPGTLSGPAVAAQYLHVTNYWIVWNGYAGQPPGTGVYWSLAVEEHFYLVFPLIYLLLRRQGLAASAQARILWVACGAVLLWRCWLVLGAQVPEDRTYLATDTRIDSLLYGCALAVWGNPAVDGPPANERLWKFGLLPGALMVLLACLLWRDAAFRETLRYSLQGAALTIVFVAAISYPDWGPFRWLNRSPVVFVGVLSYSLYLVHYPLIFLVERWLPDASSLLRGVLASVLSLATAGLIHRLVEQPCARLRRRYTTPD